MIRINTILLTAFLGLITSALSASADTMINHVPYTINTPGTYTLSVSLSGLSTPALININTSNVTLNLNGHNITMNATATGNSNGIVVTNANNVTIMNGSLTYTGTAYNFMLILLQNTVNATVENIQFNGTGAAITQPGNTAVMDDYGIGTLVTSNSVDQLAQGVFFQNCTGCVAVDNIINRGNALAFDSSANCLFKHNTVTYTAGISNTQAMALGATDQYIGNAFIGYPSSAQIIIGGINIVGK